MKEKRNLSREDRMLMARTPRLDDLLKNGRIVTTTSITTEGGWPAQSVNTVMVKLWNVVPGFCNNKFMGMEQNSKDCKRKVKVTIELID